MARAPKDAFIADIKTQLAEAAGILFVDYTGLTVAEADAFRKKFRGTPITYKVVKNSLMKRALVGTAYEDVTGCLRGTPTGVLLGREDPVTPAKLTFEFAESCEHLKVKGGVVDNRAISPDEAKALSKLPSREALQAMVVAQAQSPGRGLAGQLKNPSGRIVGAIEALHKRLEGGDEQAS
ncbi:MAG: 50S ribosomal protein L10 [Deltaproteobacteria bacterium]|nr:MAG: 50S ribosomal protein L10 [Deltaproteobacteria bacterium]